MDNGKALHVSPYFDTFYNVAGAEFLRDTNRMFRKFNIALPSRDVNTRKAPILSIEGSKVYEKRCGAKFKDGVYNLDQISKLDFIKAIRANGCAGNDSVGINSTMPARHVTIDDDFMKTLRHQCNFMGLEMYVSGVDVTFVELVVAFPQEGGEGDLAFIGERDVVERTSCNDMTLRIDVVNMCSGGEQSFGPGVPTKVSDRGNASIAFSEIEHHTAPLTSGYRVTLIFNVTKSFKQSPFLLNIPKKIVDTFKELQVEMRKKGIKKVGFLANHAYAKGTKLTRKDLKGSDLICYDALYQSVSEKIEFVNVGYSPKNGFFKSQFEGILKSLNFEQGETDTSPPSLASADFGSYKVNRTEIDTTLLRGEHLLGDACILSSVSSHFLGKSEQKQSDSSCFKNVILILCYL